MTTSPAPTNSITVLYFAAAWTATNLSSEIISLPPTPTPFPLSQLGALIVSRHPNTNIAEVLKTSKWSVDLEMVDEDEDAESVFLKGGEEVGVICPVSGG